jgi:hypothetical protein
VRRGAGYGRVVEDVDYFESRYPDSPPWEPEGYDDPPTARSTDWSERANLRASPVGPGGVPYPPGARRRANAAGAVVPTPAPGRVREDRPAVADVVDEDEFDADDEDTSGGYLAAMVATLIWFSLPAAAYVGFYLAKNGAQASDGVLATLRAAWPYLAVATVGGLLTALLLRLVTGWRTVSLGFAAATAGGAAVAVLYTVTGGA